MATTQQYIRIGGSGQILEDVPNLKRGDVVSLTADQRAKAAIFKDQFMARSRWEEIWTWNDDPAIRADQMSRYPITPGQQARLVGW